MAVGQRRIMRNFMIDEISAVDFPAQKGAVATIIKATPTKSEGGKNFPSSDYAYVPDPEKPSTWKLRLTSTPGGDPDPAIVGAAAAALGPGYRGQKVDLPAGDRAKVAARVRAAWRKANPDKKPDEMPSGLTKLGIGEKIAKAYLDPALGALSFQTVLQDRLASDRFCDVMEEIGPPLSALSTSISSIAADPNMDTAHKQLMIRDTVESFMAATRTVWPDIEEALAEDATETSSGPATPMPMPMSMSTKGDPDMNSAELEAQVASLTKQLEAATKASKDAGIAVAAQKAVEEMTAKLNDATAKLTEETAKAGMSDAEKAHMATLSGKDKMDFMQMSSADRAKAMAKFAAGDETVTIEGQLVSKRAVGEAQFEIIKRQAAKIAANEAEIAKERRAREDAEYTKRADTELKHLPGETVVKVKVLRHLDKADADVKETLGKMLAAGDKAISAAYDRVGAKGGDIGKAGNGDAKVGFEKRIDEVMAADKGLTRTEAMAKARREFPEEFKAYQDR